MFPVLLLASCVSENLPAPEEAASAVQTQDASLAEGECVVLFSDEMTADIEAALENGSLLTKSAGLNDALEAYGIRSMERLFPHAGEFEPRTRKEGLHRWYVVEYSEDIALTKASAGLSEIPGVELVEPVRKVKTDEYNDFSSDLWGLYNQENIGFDINVRPVWDNYTTGSENVIVCVVDNGVETSHEDLAWNCLSSGHYNAVDGTTKIVPGDHGTHVAGTIAAVGNNGKGIVGIAGGDYSKGTKGVQILSSQIFKETTTGTVSGDTRTSSNAIKWGADHGAVISQNSWGYVYDADGDGNVTGDELTTALASTVTAYDKQAIDYFIKYAGCDNEGNQLPDSPMKGGVVFFAAGNDAIANSAPGNYSEVIAVGSVASDGSRSSFSNYGDWVDIAAPGTAIYSTVTGNSYSKMNGTSMACPHVSGVAALVVSYHGGPGFTNEMLKERILGSANTEILPKSYKIGGLVDAYGAMVYGSDVAPAAVTDLSASVRANTLDLTWTVPADEDGKPAYGFLILYSTDKQAVEDADQNNYKAVEYTTCTPDLAAGEKAEFSLTGLEFSKEYGVKVLAYSYGRNYSAATDVLTVQTKENNAPVITLSEEGEISLKASDVLNLSVSVSEPDGHTFEVSLVNGSAADAMASLPDGTYRLTITGNAVPAGTYTAVINAEDRYGLKASKNIVYTIRDNAKPEVVKEMDDMILSRKNQEFTIDMSEYVTDADGEQLTYEIVNSNVKVVHLVPRNDKIYGTALAYGTSDVEIIARDARGEEARLSFKVLVKDPSSPVSVYPNPVTDYVNVGTLDMASTSIRISSATGKLMFEDTMEVSGLEPARIDMSSFAPGVYSLAVSFGGNEYIQNVVKL